MDYAYTYEKLILSFRLGHFQANSVTIKPWGRKDEGFALNGQIDE